jgi:nucleotide-binding universal stress UspA family protein
VIIHKLRQEQFPKNILIPCDLSARFETTVKGLKNVGLKGKQVEACHVLQPPVPLLDYQGWELIYDAFKKASAREIADFRKKHQSVKITEFLSQDIVGVLTKRAKAFDVIAISPHQTKGVLSSFGSITSKLVRASSTPVLVLP